MEMIEKLEMYIKVFEKEHKDTSYRECGFFLDERKQYLGAFPDLVIECSCCGKGVLEIQCPYPIANEIPSPENLSYLIHASNEQVTLNQNHQYFAQIQGQMAITKRKWCQFLVYTQKGFYLETIHFDADYWDKMEANLAWF